MIWSFIAVVSLQFAVTLYLTMYVVNVVWPWKEALMAAEISFKNIKRHDIQKIGMAYLNHLVENGDYGAAAR